MTEKSKKKPWDAVQYLYDNYVKGDPKMEDLLDKARESESTDLKIIEANIKSLRTKLESTHLSSKDRADCKEKLREWIYDRKTFIQKNPIEDKSCLVNPIDTRSFVDCLIKNAIKGTIQWILQKKQKKILSPEFEKDLMWVFYSGKKISNLLTFEQCCIFRGMNYENIRYAIYGISKLPIKEIKEILFKFKTKQERKHEEDSSIDFNFSQFVSNIPHFLNLFNG